MPSSLNTPRPTLAVDFTLFLGPAEAMFTILLSSKKELQIGRVSCALWSDNCGDGLTTEQFLRQFKTHEEGERMSPTDTSLSR